MTDNYINVTVTSKENKRVTVSTQEPGFEVTATTDTGKFWAQTAENWATSETIVDNIDYSSKYYANKAKVNAENARVYEASIKETYNIFVEESGNIANDVRNAGQESVNSIEDSRLNAVDSINTVKDESIASVENKANEALTLVNDGITQINTTKTTAVDSINSTKTNILKDIEFVAEGEKEEIQELAEDAKADIKSTGFYMQDDKLYFTNSKGEEEEFKSGGINDKITNCLLEIPQNIKLELNNGTLTLKAGSVVTVPNGFEEDGTTPKFDYVTVESDSSVSVLWSISAPSVIFYDVDSKTLYNQAPNYSNSNIWSGDTPTIDKQYGVWFNTSSNIIQQTRDTGATWTNQYSLPICIASTDANKAPISIDQVFNGMGYIGSTVWIDKGVKGLAPNGRNEDGSLKNIELILDKLIMRTVTGASQNMGVVFNANDVTWRTYFEQDTPPTVICRWFDTKSNLMKQNSTSDLNNYTVIPYIYLGQANFGTGGKVESFEFKQPYRAVDYNDFNVADYIAVDWSKKVNKTVSTTYTAESNGYIIANANPSGNNSLNCTVNGNEIMHLGMHGLSGVSYAQGFTIPIAKGDTYSVVGANVYYYFLPFKEV